MNYTGNIMVERVAENVSITLGSLTQSLLDLNTNQTMAGGITNSCVDWCNVQKFSIANESFAPIMFTLVFAMIGAWFLLNFDGFWEDKLSDYWRIAIAQSLLMFCMISFLGFIIWAKYLVNKPQLVWIGT